MKVSSVHFVSHLFHFFYYLFLQVPRTVIETKLIEAKPVTYHVTKYEYPNMNESSTFCSSDRGHISDGGPPSQLGPFNFRDPNSSRGLERLFLDTKKQSRDPILGMSKFDHSCHNPYGLYGTTRDSLATWPRIENALGSSSYLSNSQNVESKPCPSCGPYPSFQQPCLSSSLPLSIPVPVPVPVPDNNKNLDLNDDAGIFPSFNQHVQPKAMIFNRMKQDACH